MNKTEFLERLRAALTSASPEERAAAMQYYTEYLDEAGPQREAEVIEELGGPEKVAGDVLASAGMMIPKAAPAKEKPGAEAAGATTSTAGQAPLPSEARPNPAPEARGYDQNNTNIVKIILLVLVAIIVVPLLGGIIAAVFGVVVALICVFLVPLIVGIAFIPSGILIIVSGAFIMAVHLGSGFVVLGTGVLLLGLGLMALYGGIRLLAKTLPAIVRGAINGVSSLIRKIFPNFKKEATHG